MPASGSDTSVKDVPDSFKDRVKDNAGNIKASREKGTEPYFIRNNAAAIDDILNPKPKELTMLEKAEIRHEARTPEQTEAIRNRWAERQKKHALIRKTATKTTETSGLNTIRREVRNPLPEHVRERRKEIQRIAYKTLCTQQITVSALSALVEISKRAVKEWLNQPFIDMESKNEALLRVPQLLQNAVYRGCGVDKHDPTMNAHLFQSNIGNVECWIIVREIYKQGYKLHSLTDNSEILKIVKKK